MPVFPKMVQTLSCWYFFQMSNNSYKLLVFSENSDPERISQVIPLNIDSSIDQILIKHRAHTYFSV